MMRMPLSARAVDLRAATRSRRSRRTAGAALIALAGFGVLGACSNGGSATPSATAPLTQGTRTGGPGAGQRTPGVNGLIAAVSGTTMQVQSSTKQTAVSWTATTRVTRSGLGRLADIVVGLCVVVREATSGDATTAVGAGSGPVAAASVQVMPAPATGASCLGAVGGGFGGRGTGGGTAGANGSTPAPGAPDATAGAPTGAPGGGFGGRNFGVVGVVTAVEASGFTVASIDLAGAAGATATSAAALPTTPVSVTTSATTTVTTTRAATAGDIKVGLCTSAQGQTNESGAMTATSITLRDAVNGACTTAADGSGFGGPGGRPGASPTNG